MGFSILHQPHMLHQGLGEKELRAVSSIPGLYQAEAWAPVGTTDARACSPHLLGSPSFCEAGGLAATAMLHLQPLG